MNFMILLYVGAGGFVGAISRFLLAGFVQKSFGILFPVGTLFVNVLGSFIIGFAAMYFSEVIQPEAKAFVITGFLGALTTFSTFSLENVNMLQNGEMDKMILNIFLNVLLTLSATLLSVMLFKKIYG
ncbi:MAG: fluoride efflux transporter CrcB [Epsilonproteobacteria bacterium]|nr:fluoride efflux transporter CrcB [Campylobacterota bacterium]